MNKNVVLIMTHWDAETEVRADVGRKNAEKTKNPPGGGFHN